MGAFGEGPFDNDCALDWIGPVCRKADRTLKRMEKYILRGLRPVTAAERNLAFGARGRRKGKKPARRMRRPMRMTYRAPDDLYLEAIAAAATVLALAKEFDHYDPFVVIIAARVIRGIMKDDVFMAGWQHPDRIRKRLSLQSKDLVRLHVAVIAPKRGVRAIRQIAHAMHGL